MNQPLLIIAGIPNALYRRMQLISIQVEGWKVKIIPANHHQRTQIDKGVYSQITESAISNNEGAHIFGFSSDRDRDKWSNKLQSHFRFRWINSQYLQSLPGQIGTFIADIQREADFEQAWRGRLRPTRMSHPLMLPECAFLPKGAHVLWSEASRVSPARRSHYLVEIEKIERITERFTQLHRTHDGAWNDDQGLRFIHDPHARHGVPVHDLLNWKFSWKAPEGSHYDVTNVRGRAFAIKDPQDNYHDFKAGSHANVDCHGWCRGTESRT